MKTSLKRIYTKDSIELVGLLYEPEAPAGQKSCQKVLSHIHGMEGNFYENAFLDAIAKTLTDNGIAFFAFNNRGCEAIKDLSKMVDGKKTLIRIGNAYEKFEESALDVAASIDFLEKEGFTEIHMAGHSLGCAKLAYYLSETNDGRVQSALFLSPSDMLGLVRANKERFASEIEAAAQMIAAGKGDQLMPNQVWDEYPISAATYLSLFGDDSKCGIFNFYDPADKLAALSKIHCPAIAIMGRKDDALTVPMDETMERFAKALANSPRVETNILGDANHGYDGYEQQLADAIRDWLVSFE
ncbi:MAG: hypothetical protein JWO73_208 [Candidatus Taylorbacteria bacterium]|nr:hypothetical protein [Candidatus Taylorbacteria bacterium]